MGGSHCCIMGCSNRTGGGVSLHTFPKDPGLRARWIKSIKSARTGFSLSRWRGPSQYSSASSHLVCSSHFPLECFTLTTRTNWRLGLDYRPTLRDDAVPTLFGRNVRASNNDLPESVRPVNRRGEVQGLCPDLRTMTHSEGKDASVSRTAQVLKETEDPEPQMLSIAAVKRRTVSSGTQCPYCRYRCGSKFSFQIHVGSQHPLHCEDTCVGRLGKVVFYQRTAKLFHCHICFFTSKDYAVVFEHLLARHCLTFRKNKGNELTSEINPDSKDASENQEQEASSEDSLKRKRGSVSSCEDEDEDTNSTQAANEEQAVALETYSENSSALYHDCTFCKQRCRSKGSLLRHVSLKHNVPKPHSCKECSETFMLESLLTRHINLQHRRSLYQCPYCVFESSLQGLHQHLSQCRAGQGGDDKGDIGTDGQE
ncbi:uncharacterized protein Hap1MRO34_002093 [Clarias gariepinus]